MKNLYLIIFLVCWFALRLLDFVTGFVVASPTNVLLACCLPVTLSLSFVPAFKHRTASILRRSEQFLTQLRPKYLAACLVFLGLGLAGLLLFVSRAQYKAYTGDTDVFFSIVMNTANPDNARFFHDSALRHMNQFRLHNNAILFLLVPLIWLFGVAGWGLIQYLHSLLIVGLSFLGGRSLAEHTKTGFPVLLTWIATLSLYLATYRSHVGFSDARVGAFFITLLAYGIIMKNRRLIYLGFVLALVSRETIAFLTIPLVLFLATDAVSRRARIALVAIALVWLLLTMLIMTSLGGPVPNLQLMGNCTSDSLLLGQLCAQNLLVDSGLKLAYTLRLLSFAPALLLFWPAWLILLPELALAWFSDSLVYDLKFQYYLAPLGLAVVIGASRLKPYSRAIQYLLLWWLIITGLYQFATTVSSSTFYMDPPPPLAEMSVNLIRNGTFERDMSNSWIKTGNIQAWRQRPYSDDRYVISEELYFNNPLDPSSGSIYQELIYTFPQDVALELALDLGNTSSVNKPVQVLLYEPANGYQRICNFVVPPAASLQSYFLHARTTEEWHGIRVILRPAADGLPDMVLDNVELQVQPEQSYPEVQCIAPVSNTPLDTNLLLNGDFSKQTSSWVIWGVTSAWTMQPDGAGGYQDTGVLYLNSRSEPGGGGVYQDLVYTIPENSTLELSMEIGNSSSYPKAIQAVVREPVTGEMAVCDFTVLPGEMPQLFSMRLETRAAWTNIRVEFNPAADSLPDLILDNVDLQVQSEPDSSQTACHSPRTVAAPDSIVLQPDYEKAVHEY